MTQETTTLGTITQEVISKAGIEEAQAVAVRKKVLENLEIIADSGMFPFCGEISMETAVQDFGRADVVLLIEEVISGLQT